MDYISSKECIAGLKNIIKRIENGELNATHCVVIIGEPARQVTENFDDKYKIIPIPPMNSIEGIGILQLCQSIITHGYWENSKKV